MCTAAPIFSRHKLHEIMLEVFVQYMHVSCYSAFLLAIIPFVCLHPHLLPKGHERFLNFLSRKIQASLLFQNPINDINFWKSQWRLYDL